MSCPVRGMWIEIQLAIVAQLAPVSCPVRGMWIEMMYNPCTFPDGTGVVPRKGHVD